MQARAAQLAHAQRTSHPLSSSSSSAWTPLGPVPLASDATHDGFQNYNQVSGRSTAVTIDPADPTGNTVYIGGAQAGVWKSTNAATPTADNVTWAAITDDQATLSIGSIAIQPGNSNPSQSLIVVGTGEPDNSADSYYGLGFLRSTDGGNTWSLISTANAGALSFSGLGAARMAFSTASGQTSTLVAAMAAASEGVTDGALTFNTQRGLYTSTDAGQTWTFTAPFSGTTQFTSATAVAWNAAAGLFFAAERYHGFYSSPDGLTWTRLANQPGALNTASCPLPNVSQTGFLPNVAVTALEIFDSGGQKLLRASTYGRGVWQFPLAVTPDFQIAISNSPLTAFAGTTPTFNGTLTALDGYSSLVVLSCIPGSTNPPSPCTPNPATLTPTSGGAAFTVTTGATVGNYDFSLQAIGSDPNSTTHIAALTLDIVSFGLTSPSPSTVIASPGTTSPAVSFEVTAQGSFSQSVTLTCSFSPALTGATCNFTPGAIVNPTGTVPVAATASVNVPAGAGLTNYTVTLQATTSGAPAPATTTFGLTVAAPTPAYTIAGPATLSSAPSGVIAANLTFTSVNSFSGQVNASCAIPTLSGSICTLSLPNPISIASGAVVPVTANINVPTSAPPGVYNVNITSEDVNGLTGDNVTIPLTVYQDFTISTPTPSSQAISPGQQATYNFTVLPIGTSFTNAVNLSCSGAPTVSLCAFTPDPAIPGSNAVNVTITISTTATSSSNRRPSAAFLYVYAMGLALPGIVLLAAVGRRRQFISSASLLALLLLLLLLQSCGSGSNGGGAGGGGGQQQGTAPGTYNIIVEGTAGTLTHQSSPVTLTVE